MLYFINHSGRYTYFKIVAHICEFFFSIQTILSAETYLIIPDKTLQIPVVSCPQHLSNWAYRTALYKISYFQYVKTTFKFSFYYPAILLSVYYPFYHYNKTS